MANSKGSSNYRNFLHAGQQSLLPPRIPFPSVPTSYIDYGSNSSTSRGVPKPRQGLKHHQRTSSESFLIEEQPSWVEELLNEPETPVRRGHRRSSSDSFTYFDSANASMDSLFQEPNKFKNIASLPRTGSGDFDHYRDTNHTSFYPELNSFMRQQWDPSVNLMAYPGGLPSGSDSTVPPTSGFSCPPQEPAGVSSIPTEKQDQEDSSGPHDPKVSSERSDYTKPSPSEIDPKRAKQQFAQRSRVRKLQYIAELERNVQALQADGSEVAAEIEFLDQQGLLLNMENKALKHRLDGLAQEQLIKCVEQEMLEREIARLRVLYHQQQLQQHHQHQLQQRAPSAPRRSSSREHLNLDAQFSSLSLKHEAGTGRDPVSGSLRI